MALFHLKRAVVTIATVYLASSSALAAHDDWALSGQNLNNTRSQDKERRISRANVARLAPKWVFEAGGDISATPAVVGDTLYVPDWGGNLHSIDTRSGKANWTKKIADYTGIADSVTRTTPAVLGGRLILGSQQGAYLMSIDARSGELMWKTQLDAHPLAQITQSASVHGGRVYVGISSGEEGAAANPSYECCTFRGSMTAVDLESGKILWKTYMTPDNGGQPGGYSGAAVWGSMPVVDAKRNAVYIGTGNNYDVPAAVKECVRNLTAATPQDQANCQDPNNHVVSVLALDLDTGMVRWVRRAQGYDAWTVSCFQRGPNCADPEGPDYDFAQGPMLIDVKGRGRGRGGRELLAIGQKSGVMWALDPTNGDTVWQTLVGPGGTLGGSEWGSASDGQRIYVAIGNNAFKPYQLQPSGEKADGGSWSALDAASGKIVWQTADPTGAIDIAALTVANGIVYGGSMAPASGRGVGAPNMYALDARSGKILWSFDAGASVNAGAAVADGVVYWGAGYARFNLGTAGNKLYAFTPDNRPGRGRRARR